MAEKPRRDYYEVLGVGRSATKDEIKAAFRQLARRYHPDVNSAPDAAERFKEVRAAFEVLSNDERRARYDRFGHAEPPPGIDLGGFGGLDDLFSGLGFDLFNVGGFGPRARAPRTERGADLRYDLEVSFEDAFKGVEIGIKLPRLRDCPECGGTGARKGTGKRRCPQCNGTGRREVRRQAGFATFVSVGPCPGCEGTGEFIDEPCAKCRGDGHVTAEETIEVKVPAGVDTGSHLRVAGRGEPGMRGGPPGDLYIVVHVRPNELFERDGADVRCTVPITFAAAALGADVRVPTVDGEDVVRVPAGTQTGDRFTLRGRGFARLRGAGRGDQVVEVRVTTPERLTSAQRRRLREFAAAMEWEADGVEPGEGGGEGADGDDGEDDGRPEAGPEGRGRRGLFGKMFGKR